MKKYTLIGLLVTSLLLTIIFSSYAAENITTLRVAAGGLQGSTYATFVALAAMINKVDPTIKIVVVPGGGIANSARAGSGEIETANTFPPMNKAAFNGTTPFKEAYPDLRGGITGYAIALNQFVVTTDTGLETIDDLINQKYPIKLAVERVGCTDEYSLNKILEFYGVDYDTIGNVWGGSILMVGYGDQVILIKDRHANAVFQNIGVPGPTIIEMVAGRKDLKLLKFSDELLKYMGEKYAYAIGVAPKGIYANGMPQEDLKCPAMTNTWSFNKNVPEDVVYRITKIVCENADLVRKIHPSTVGFDSAKACFGSGLPLHPGAERYYKEAGYIK